MIWTALECCCAGSLVTLVSTHPTPFSSSPSPSLGWMHGRGVTRVGEDAGARGVGQGGCRRETAAG
eukprot:3202219-Rhodomonas_salina.2